MRPDAFLPQDALVETLTETLTTSLMDAPIEILVETLIDTPIEILFDAPVGVLNCRAEKLSRRSELSRGKAISTL